MKSVIEVNILVTRAEWALTLGEESSSQENL